MIKKFSQKDYWRAIILYGLNTATYKIALGQALLDFAQKDKTIIIIDELAEKFFNLYSKRLEKGMPQLNLPNRITVMERVINEYNLGKINKSQAIAKVSKDAFNDVIPRFHTVNNEEIPLKFYEFEDNKLILTDDVFKVNESYKQGNALEELSSRWDLLEVAFLMKRENYELQNDVRQI